ncbi:ABC transporter substrate-binding protein [Neomegalonema sp.]|uniref:ABC transporter substrate-binding protein n=1 Tax=Neomegalonema sp. TaxID=2039713 RepID=UPI002604C691|nr:ABC transporter substrate-binding protein [Neomegalonema sp.]MDD2868663.1 ABC transporter substrate-binding protein [Neomegalonema sp.]
MKFRASLAALVAGGVLTATPVLAADISMVLGSVGQDATFMAKEVKLFEEATGHKVTIVPMPASTTDQFGQYRLWLAQGKNDIDVYQTDVIWAPQLADQFLDLTEAAKDVVGAHFPAIIESQTVGGKLVALPIFTDAPGLYYRTDLLEKHGEQPPKTWDELAATAKKIVEAERAAGAKDMWGFVWQGASYEGLTCNALEWVKSSGGGQIVEADGTISINNPEAAAALDRARGWISDGITPPGVLSYQEEEARGVWQLGNSVFMRNWPYAYGLGSSADSVIKGKFAAIPLPSVEGQASAATLGGWNLAVSRHSRVQEPATELVLFLTSAEAQKRRAIENSQFPTVMALYDDPEIAEKQPVTIMWKDILTNAVPRPSAPTKLKYNEVSSRFWNAAHSVLSGQKTGAEALEELEVGLARLQGRGW